MQYRVKQDSATVIAKNADWLVCNLNLFPPVSDPSSRLFEPSQTAFAELCLLIFLGHRERQTKAHLSRVLKSARRLVNRIGNSPGQRQFYENLPLGAFPAFLLFRLASGSMSLSKYDKELLASVWRTAKSQIAEYPTVRVLEFHYLWSRLAR
jgi:hypothetical protein